jgi:ATP-dependent Clp protease adapter protein ClpS
MGVSDAVLNLNDPNTMASLMQSMARKEGTPTGKVLWRIRLQAHQFSKTIPITFTVETLWKLLRGRTPTD